MPPQHTGKGGIDEDDRRFLQRKLTKIYGRMEPAWTSSKRVPKFRLRIASAGVSTASPSR